MYKIIYNKESFAVEAACKVCSIILRNINKFKNDWFDDKHTRPYKHVLVKLNFY